MNLKQANILERCARPAPRASGTLHHVHSINSSPYTLQVWKDRHFFLAVSAVTAIVTEGFGFAAAATLASNGFLFVSS
jgi:hypothetical protein